MTAQDPRPALLLKNLSKVFRSFRTQKATEVVAVNNISLRIEPGEIVGLLGPNGAGKSTLVDMILGLISPTSGTVEVFGQSPKDMIRQSRLGAVMQTGGLLPELTVEETVAMIAPPHTKQTSLSAKRWNKLICFRSGSVAFLNAPVVSNSAYALPSPFLGTQISYC